MNAATTKCDLPHNVFSETAIYVYFSLEKCHQGRQLCMTDDFKCFSCPCRSLVAVHNTLLSREESLERLRKVERHHYSQVSSFPTRSVQTTSYLHFENFLLLATLAEELLHCVRCLKKYRSSEAFVRSSDASEFTNLQSGIDERGRKDRSLQQRQDTCGSKNNEQHFKILDEFWTAQVQGPRPTQRA